MGGDIYKSGNPLLRGSSGPARARTLVGSPASRLLPGCLVAPPRPGHSSASAAEARLRAGVGRVFTFTNLIGWWLIRSWRGRGVASSCWLRISGRTSGRNRLRGERLVVRPEITLVPRKMPTLVCARKILVTWLSAFFLLYV